VPMLDQSRRWDSVLSEAEQQSLAFARAVLHAPAWILIDEVLDTLEPETLKQVSRVLADDLTHTAVIHIGRDGGREAHPGQLYGRVLHLVMDPSAHRLAAPRLLAEPSTQRAKPSALTST